MPSRPSPAQPAAAASDRRFSSPFAELTAGLRGDGTAGGMWGRAGERLRRAVRGQATEAQTTAPASAAPSESPSAGVAQVSTPPPKTKTKARSPGAQRRREAALASLGKTPTKGGSHGGIRFVAAPAAPEPAPKPSEGPSISFLRQRLTDGIIRLDSIFNSLSGMGEWGDTGSANQVDMQRVPLTTEECMQLCRFNAYAARIVEELPNDVCQKGWFVSSTDVANEDQGRLGVEAAKALELVQRVEKAMIWARMTGTGVIMIVCDEEVPASARRAYLSQPLGTYPIRRIRALQTFDRTELSIWSWEGNARLKRYRSPKHYLITPRVQTDSVEMGTPVHASRLMMFSGRELPELLKSSNSGFDDSVLQMAFDAIVGCTAVDKVGQTLVQKLSTTTLSTAALEEMDGPEMLVMLRERARMIAEQQSNQNLLLLQPGETVATQGVQITGFDEIANRAALQLCAASGMPATRLFGEAPAGFNTDGASQEKLWDRRVVIAQEKIRPVLHQFYNALFASLAGPTGGQPLKYEIVFPPTTTLTSTEEAALRLAVAQVDQIYLTMGVFTPQDVGATRGQTGGHLKDVIVQTRNADQEKRLRAADLAAQAEEDRLRAQEQAAPTTQPAATEAVATVAPASAATPVAVEPRLDAEPGSAVIWLELPEDAVRAHQRLIADLERGVPTLAIEPETTPHITLLHLGVLANPKADVELIKRAMDEFGTKWPVFQVLTDTLRTFPVQEDGELTPLTLSIREGDWHMTSINARLLRRLAHIVQAEQFDEYAAHATLGYARLSSALRDQVMQQPLKPIEFTATRMRLVMDSKVIHETVFPGHGWPGSIASL